ncbi:MAG: hypothetical protein JNL10_14775 [Verrucomicrobiales bacterium]|nr:hypothetical protein [Verrucomicrobiales bacterium]
MRKHWQALLDPVASASDGFWKLGSGPALRVVTADPEESLGLVVEVRSLRQAREFLQPRGMAEGSVPGPLRLAGPWFQGLKISLVERGGRGP